MNWTYVIMPAFIMRYYKTNLELKRLDTDEWVDKSTNPDFWKMVEEDGFSASEKEALAAHEQFKNEANLTAKKD